MSVTEERQPANGEVAELLAEVLGDDELWLSHSELAEGPLATRAQHLYVTTWPMFQRAFDERETLRAEALWLIREVADRCAVMSARSSWSPEETGRWVNLPTRDAIDAAIRRSGVDRWCASLGVRLPPDNRPSSLPPPSARRVWKAKTKRAWVAREFVEFETKYRKLLDIRGELGSVRLQEAPLLRNIGPGLIGVAYNNLLWAEIKEDEVIALVSRALLLIGQGVFGLAHMSDDSDRASPPPEFFRDFLDREGVRLWAAEGVGNASSWLSRAGGRRMARRHRG